MNCDTSVLYKTKRYHHQRVAFVVVVVVVVMLKEGFPSACLHDSREVKLER